MKCCRFLGINDWLSCKKLKREKATQFDFLPVWLVAGAKTLLAHRERTDAKLSVAQFGLQVVYKQPQVCF